MKKTCFGAPKPGFWGSGHGFEAGARTNPAWTLETMVPDAGNHGFQRPDGGFARGSRVYTGSGRWKQVPDAGNQVSASCKS